MKMTVTETDNVSQVAAATEKNMDITPKRFSAIVHPAPRRLLPPNTPTFMSSKDTSADDNYLQNIRYPFQHQNLLDTNQEQSISTGSANQPEMPRDLSVRRTSSFSVNDLLGKRESKRPSAPVHVQTSPTMMTSVPYPTFPQTHIFPPRITPNIQMERTMLPVKQETSPPERRPQLDRSPIGPSRSLTSSPESPRSDISVSDRSDPNSSTDPDTSPGSYKAVLDRKSNRTNYTPVQVRRLEKIFLENPYPEHELYEQLSKELSIPEPRLKVWFQNKRARWKRRAEDKITQQTAYPFPMMPMGYPYGMIPGHMGSSPESHSTMAKHMFSYPTPSPMMMYPGGYPTPMYPYLPHQMYVQQ